MSFWKRVAELGHHFADWMALVQATGDIAETFNTDASERFYPQHFQAGRQATARDHAQHDEAMDWAYFEYFE